MTGQTGTIGRQGWFARNWFWAVPVGLALTLTLVGATAVAAAFLGVFKAVEASEPYQQAVTRAAAHPAVARELGEDVHATATRKASLKFHNESGSADFVISLAGSRKEGTLYATARRKEGKWTFSTLEVAVEGQSRPIDLLTGADAESAPVQAPGETRLNLPASGLRGLRGLRLPGAL